MHAVAFKVEFKNIKYTKLFHVTSSFIVTEYIFTSEICLLNKNALGRLAMLLNFLKPCVLYNSLSN